MAGGGGPGGRTGGGGHHLVLLCSGLTMPLGYRFNPWATSTSTDFKHTSVKKTEGDRPRVPYGSRSGKGFRTVTLDNGATINHLTY